ncbi:MAG TPA: M48 family metalloprotease [Candidatus Woesebacteria bacterium]|nr:M48 family metalloprotease [Candidatus Woesebacteria bacterium]
MRSKIFKNIYTIFSLLFLLGYVTILVLLTERVLESCFTNFLRLYYSQVNLTGLVTDSHPVINLVGLIITAYLWFRLVKALITVTLRFINYRYFINSLVAINKGNVLIIKNKSNLLFTAGIKNPQIWISENLLKLLDQAQYEAVISHERSHVLNKDPLWKTLNEFLKEAFPPIPKLKMVIDKFNIVIELTADEYAIQKTSSESLLAALLLLMKKTGEIDNPLLVGFKSNSERLQILTKKKKLNHFAISSYSSALLVSFTFLAVALVSFNLFNHCSDPKNCISMYTTNGMLSSNQTESCNELPVTHNQLFSPIQ